MGTYLNSMALAGAVAAPLLTAFGVDSLKDTTGFKPLGAIAMDMYAGGAGVAGLALGGVLALAGRNGSAGVRTAAAISAGIGTGLLGSSVLGFGTVLGGLALQRQAQSAG
jgi:hypothetical protein